MIHVKVKNRVNNKEFQAQFETRQEADSWLDSHIRKDTFGKKAHKVYLDKKPKEAGYKILEDYEIDPVTMELVLDEDGMPVVSGYKYQVEVPCEYDITIQEAETSLDAPSYLALLRKNRNEVLSITDFTQIADCPISPEIKKLFREYREYLRDFTRGVTLESVRNIKLQNFHEFYRKKYIEVSSLILNSTNNINEKIKQILG